MQWKHSLYARQISLVFTNPQEKHGRGKVTFISHSSNLQFPELFFFWGGGELPGQHTYVLLALSKFNGRK